jgi:16S rRNA C967 or C1407 C5-methylase (RsmB/RsmF family)
MKQGWSMLRQGGVMVYSTCSLSIRQNEENVAWFLTSHHNAVLEKIPDFGITAAPIKHQTVAQDLQPSIDTFCLRFDPIHSGTSGFFLVRFKKSALNKEQEE